MRTIAIASYFSGDFKKTIELMMMTHPYNQFQNWEDAGYAQFSSHEQESPHSLVPESYVDRKRVNHTQLATIKHGVGKKFRV
jgi:hypothetical protein